MMKTKILKIHQKKPEKRIIEETVRIIKKGGIVAFPTETVYGLGTSIFNKKGIAKIYRIRKRPLSKALLILIARKKDLKKYVKKIPPLAKKLVKKFWPGPLTLIFFKRGNIPNFVTAGKKTVAIRIPENKFLIKLIKKLNQPIVAPSANLAGEKSPIVVDQVIKNFFGKIDLILDGGKTKYQKESTILDLTQKKVMVLRKGAMFKKIKKFLISKQIW